MNLTEKPLSSEYPYRGKSSICGWIRRCCPTAVRPCGGGGASRRGAWPPSPTGRSCCLSGSSAIRIRRRFWNCLRGKRSPGEDPLECGIRELKEETGAVAARVEPLGRLYPSPWLHG